MEGVAGIKAESPSGAISQFIPPSIYPAHPFYPVHLVALIGFEQKR
jgi:hypothetical protein